MKKLAFLFLASACLSIVSLSGCGGSESSVVEAPAEVAEEEASMPGMSEEDYDAAMEADMNEQ